MDIIEKLGDTISSKGKEVADKAKELAEVANLKSQISTCEEVGPSGSSKNHLACCIRNGEARRQAGIFYLYHK